MRGFMNSIYRKNIELFVKQETAAFSQR